MVPLYGQGQSLFEPEQEDKVIIPPRPPACGINGLAELFNPERQLTSRDSYPSIDNFPNPYNVHEGDSWPPLLNLRGIAPMALSHPVVGMFGEMVYASVSGNSECLHTYPNSYHSVGSSTPRLRMQEF